MVRTPTDPAYLRDLFNNSARYYDSVNVITSLGQVVLWRKEVVRAASLRPTDRVLDAFCGPGGLAAEALPLLGRGGELVLADLSPVMIHEARKRIARVRMGRRLARGEAARRGGAAAAAREDTVAAGSADTVAAATADEAATVSADGPPRVEFVVGDLLRDDLGLRDFDVVFMGWGLRYVDSVDETLACVRPFARLGGRLVVLEFTRPPRLSWATPAHLYFRYLLPKIGSWLAEDRELHEYLSISAAEFLTARGLCLAVERAGFTTRSCKSHLGGLVTIVAAQAT